MTDLQTLIKKRISVPETNTRYFGPTVVQKTRALKKTGNFAIPKRSPSLAVGAKGTQQKDPNS